MRLILFLALVLAYAIGTTHTGCNGIGLLDHAALLFLILWVQAAIQRVPARGLRALLKMAVMGCFGLFFYLNTLHFRFFHTWGDASAARQWEDLRSILSSLKVLSKPLDAFFFFFVPLVAWRLACRDRPVKISRWAFVFIISGCMLAHACLASPELLYNENDPLMVTLRREIQGWVVPRDGRVRGIGDMRGARDYQLMNASLYKSAGQQDFPLLKFPLPQRKPLPFQINNNPNVVLVLMESVRAYESGAYGASPTLTPHLDQLAKEGFLFKNFYANSFQTVRGEFAIHASYLPALHGSPEYIVKPDSVLQTWPMLLQQHGYHTLWIASYAPSYDNKEEFLSHHGMDSFYWSIPKGFSKIGWGPSDDDLFNYAFTLLAKQVSPYFAEIMTLSNHFPWEGGMPTAARTPQVTGEPMYQKYARGIFYTDDAIGKFMDRVRASPQFDNTVFIFCGDHGIWLFPESVPPSPVLRQEVYFRVPFIVWSKHLKPRVIDTLGSQIDVGPTLLDLLGVHDKNYFQGTSLFRQDIAARLVLMSQDGRWNMRRGNLYTYDVGPEVFDDHYPFNNAEYNRLVRNKHIQHVDFVTDEDILHNIDPQHLTLIHDARQIQRQHAFAESAFAFYHHLMEAGKIAPKEVNAKSAQSL